MARLQDLRQAFTPLNWADKLVFMEEYRTKRYNDLNTVQEFDLSKAKTKSTKIREKKEPAAKKRTKNNVDISALTEVEIDLLKKLGVIK
jgi:hypothetical protein